MFLDVKAVIHFLVSLVNEAEFLIKERAFILSLSDVQSLSWGHCIYSYCILFYNGLFAASVLSRLFDWVALLRDFSKRFKSSSLVIPSSEGKGFLEMRAGLEELLG